MQLPKQYSAIVAKSEEIGFSMPSDQHMGSLLRSLVASKQDAKVLELGTGTGLALSWIVEGLSATSMVISIDNDKKLNTIANSFFKNDRRVNLLCMDGSQWINQYSGTHFDLIFADAWPGKYSDIEKTLALLNVGGLYIVDDMLPQPNWPEGHADKVTNLLTYLSKRDDFFMTQLNWSTGVVIATKLS